MWLLTYITLAIAFAVSILSPVTILTVMPAAWQVETYTREKKRKQKQEIEEHSVQSSPVNMEETSVIDSNIREETSQVRKRQVKSGRDKCDRQQYKRREEYTKTTNLKVQCNTNQVYDQWY